ncbi:hypothetical protein JOB18_040099 [Solea senegalensis]|uniref:OCIA domain-containing protein n=1 Tax=Solea senegalensis TaxID=28829 RepID=A0AAV6SB87_SOLSE|nr:hypothetical protein JOB18_040099 [Solea senegalensis]
MSSETSGQTTEGKTEEAVAVGTKPTAVKGEWKCPSNDGHIHREDVRKVWKECQEESFWYRALPLSLGSMAVTGGLIYNGVWKQSKRLGPFPKLAVAGILGYADLDLDLGLREVLNLAMDTESATMCVKSARKGSQLHLQRKPKARDSWEPLVTDSSSTAQVKGEETKVIPVQ